MNPVKLLESTSSNAAFAATELALFSALAEVNSSLSAEAGERDYLVAVIARLRQLLALHDSGLRDIDLDSKDLTALVEAAWVPNPPAWENEPAASPSRFDCEVRDAFTLNWSEVAAFPNVVGLTGKPGAGKDAIAFAYAHHLQAGGRPVIRMAFSDPIMEEANAFLAHYGRRITPATKSWGPYRFLLQTFGVVRRREDPEYWTKRLLQRIGAEVERVRNMTKAFGANGEPVVFLTGVRTPSDMAAVRSIGGEVWRVVRPCNPYKADHEIERQLDHLSADDFDTTFFSYEAFYIDPERAEFPHGPRAPADLGRSLKSQATQLAYKAAGLDWKGEPAE